VTEPEKTESFGHTLARVMAMQVFALLLLALLQFVYSR
jgi:hypothetical protein